MNKLSCMLIMICSMLLTAFSAQAASDCSGSWQVLQNRGGQSPCRALGLDSKRGICRPGDTYETLCDDAKGGKYRICQGPRRCGASAPPQAPPSNNDCTYWDYDRNRPCPQGARNMDCRGGCDAPRSNSNPCQGWDYNYNQPCPPGYVNYDCRGGCEAR